MEYINTKEFELYQSCVTLGKFDGIHLGHRKLLAELMQRQQAGEKLVVFTFDFHPGMLLAGKEQKVLYTLAEKQVILEKAGVDVLVAYPFSKETAAIPAEDFIERILCGQLGMRWIAVGTDNRFGHNRRGDAGMLKEYAGQFGYGVSVVDKVQLDRAVVSSTRIREELSGGRIEAANRLLGEPYHIRGIVQHGRRIGHTIDFPTLNLIPPEEKLLPPNGVYATKTQIGSEIYYGMTNIGVRPTVGEQVQPWVETHLFDFDRECYGEEICTSFYHYTRTEQRFHGVEELKAQLQKDKSEVRAYFMSNKKC